MRTRSSLRRLSQRGLPNISDLIAIGLQPTTVDGRRSSPLKSSVALMTSLRSNSGVRVQRGVFATALEKEKALEPAPKKRYQRIPYTDQDDWIILNYIITNDLVSKIRSHRTWIQLETAGVTLHSAESMRSRFMHSIIHHLEEVLHSTSEGRRKYGNASFVNGLYRMFANESKSLQQSDTPTSDKESPVVLSDLSYFTSDNSAHDGDPNSFASPSLAQPPLNEQVRLVDYEDTQSQRSEKNQGNASPELSSNPNSLQKTLTEHNPSARLDRRLSLRLNDGLTRARNLRSRRIFSRPQFTSTRVLRSSVNNVHALISVDPPATATYDQSAQALPESLRPSTKRKSDGTSSGSDNGSVTILNDETKGLHKATLEESYLAKPSKQMATRAVKKNTIVSRFTDNIQQESGEGDYGSTFTKAVRSVRPVTGSLNSLVNNHSASFASDGSERRSERVLRSSFEAVDLDSVQSSSREVDLDSSKLLDGIPPNVEIIPDTLSANSLDRLANTRESQGHSDTSSSSFLRTGKLNNTPPKFPLMQPSPGADIHEILSRVAKFTRQLDSFARRHRLSSTNAALLLHVTSGDVEAADRVLTGASASADNSPSLWFPSDDARLLSFSSTDLHAVYHKFGPKEVSRRLVYLADQSLFSSSPSSLS